MPDAIDLLLADLAQRDAASEAPRDEVPQTVASPTWADITGEMGLTLPVPNVIPGLCDPIWKMISASLRKDPGAAPCLYLKLPNTVLREVIQQLQDCIALAATGPCDGRVIELGTLPDLLSFLKREVEASRAQSIFLRISVEDAEKDVQSLKAVQTPTTGEKVKGLAEALEGGLRNDPSYDWIARCGGPTCNVSLDQTCACKGSDSASDNASSPCCGAEILGLPK
jgi:hypothetical protein